VRGKKISLSSHLETPAPKLRQRCKIFEQRSILRRVARLPSGKRGSPRVNIPPFIPPFENLLQFKIPPPTPLSAAETKKKKLEGEAEKLKKAG